MELEQVIPYTTSEGNQYLIKFEVVDPKILPISIGIPIVDLSLVQVKKVKQNSQKLFIFLAQYISDYIGQFDVILYYYCDHGDIDMRKTRNISPQHYRHKVFSTIYDTIPNDSLIRLPIIIDDEENGDHYISIITSRKNEKELDILHENILSISTK